MIFIALCLILSIESYAQKIKVACVGNSITYGSRVENREQNSYPAQLQRLLGEEYEVVNFGVSATTALYKGLYPYVEKEKYNEFKIMGTDDQGGTAAVYFQYESCADSKNQGWVNMSSIIY